MPAAIRLCSAEGYNTSMWKKVSYTASCVLGITLIAGCVQKVTMAEDRASPAPAPITQADLEQKDGEAMQNVAHATFGGGCFWCTEAVFLELKGVEKVVSGYSGGFIENPTYREICSGATGHAEVIHITYDPEQISFAELLEVFFKTHDPTTLNRQGADRGTQYRSVIFFHSEKQQKTAEHVIKELDASGAYDDPIVTEVTQFEKLYPAEDYHQNYYAQNSSEGYCRAVIQPKLEKFRKVFADKLAGIEEEPAVEEKALKESNE